MQPWKWKLGFCRISTAPKRMEVLCREEIYNCCSSKSASASSVMQNACKCYWRLLKKKECLLSINTLDNCCWLIVSTLIMPIHNDAYVVHAESSNILHENWPHGSRWIFKCIFLFKIVVVLSPWDNKGHSILVWTNMTDSRLLSSACDSRGLGAGVSRTMCLFPAAYVTLPTGKCKIMQPMSS